MNNIQRRARISHRAHWAALSRTRQEALHELGTLPAVDPLDLAFVVTTVTVRSQGRSDP